MLVNWLFQIFNTNDEVLQRLIYAAEELGDKVHVNISDPLSTKKSYEAVNYIFKQEDIVIVHGAIAACKAAQRIIPSIPTCWCDWKKFRCSSYYCHYFNHLTQKPLKWTMLPLGILPKAKTYLFGRFGIINQKQEMRPEELNTQIFVRPDENTKRFTGQLVSKYDFSHWYDLTLQGSDIEDLVVIAEPVALIDEYRVVIADGKAITGSQYIKNKEIDYSKDCPTSVLTFAEEVSKLWTPHPVFVMDIAINDKDEASVLEIGSINCAGLYELDVKKIAQAEHDIAVREFKDVTEV